MTLMNRFMMFRRTVMDYETAGVVKHLHTIRIDKNDLDPIIPDWVYTGEPGEVVRQLISDGMPHMAHEVHVILGSLYADDKDLNRLVTEVGGYTFIMNAKLWIAKKELTLYESSFSSCISKVLDMYETETEHTAFEIKNEISNSMLKAHMTLTDILARVRLILFLRNAQGCLRTDFSKELKIEDGGKRMSYGEGKAIREPSDGKGRFDLITPYGLERLAKWYELGAKKYSDRNWEKGLPFSRYFDSAMRHMVKFIMGRYEEDHLAAAVWNLMAIMHHQALDEMELDDLPHYVTRKKINDE